MLFESQNKKKKGSVVYKKALANIFDSLCSIWSSEIHMNHFWKMKSVRGFQLTASYKVSPLSYRSRRSTLRDQLSAPLQLIIYTIILAPRNKINKSAIKYDFHYDKNIGGQSVVLKRFFGSQLQWASFQKKEYN